MSLAERIQKDLTEAMKSKEELRLSVLRMVKSAIKNKEIEKIRPLDEAESLQVLQTLVKQRKESVEQFTKGGRTDLADKETREIAIIETYLPAGASEADLDRAIEAAIAETGANSPEADGRGDQIGQGAALRQDAWTAKRFPIACARVWNGRAEPRAWNARRRCARAVSECGLAYHASA